MKEVFVINRGITLVALVITIITLLILAGITIIRLTGNELIEKTQLSKEKSENAQIEENKTLLEYENKIDEYINGTRDTYIFTEEQLEKYVQQKLNEEYLYYTFDVSKSGLGTTHYDYKNYFTIPDSTQYQYLYTTWYVNAGGGWAEGWEITPTKDRNMDIL